MARNHLVTDANLGGTDFVDNPFIGVDRSVPVVIDIFGDATVKCVVFVQK